MILWIWSHLSVICSAHDFTVVTLDLYHLSQKNLVNTVLINKVLSHHCLALHDGVLWLWLSSSLVPLWCTSNHIWLKSILVWKGNLMVRCCKVQPHLQLSHCSNKVRINKFGVEVTLEMLDNTKSSVAIGLALSVKLVLIVMLYNTKC
jgi:hypothetical protein